MTSTILEQQVSPVALNDGGKDEATCIPWPIPPPNQNPEVKHIKMFIDNQWKDAISRETYNDVNPSNEELIAQIPNGGKADVNEAVAAAKRAFKPGSPWRKLDASDRGILISKLADLVDSNKHHLACLETLDSGKPYLHSFFMDTTAISKILRYYAGFTDKIHGKTVPIDGDYLSYTLVQPMGVCGLILPWNMPLISLAMKLGPALCCGNTIIIKPCEQTPLTALYIASLVQKAEFPPGVINVVTGGPEAGEAITTHTDVHKVSFTGSLEVGRKIKAASSKTNLKRLTLELSGNCPNIVFPDADIDYAVEQSHQAVFMNQGQMCTAGARTFVHESIYEEFVAKSVLKASKKIVSDPFEVYCEQGPQISRKHFDNIMSYIDSGIKEGATLKCGGERLGESGLYIQPTVFSNVTDEMRIAKEEIFGPVQCIFKYANIDEVIQRANNTEFGLAAGIFTKDVGAALEVAKYLESGTVWINCYNVFAVQSPFGGLKLSGMGKEMGQEALKEFSDIKTITLKLPHLENISYASNTAKHYAAPTATSNDDKDYRSQLNQSV